MPTARIAPYCLIRADMLMEMLFTMFSTVTSVIIPKKGIDAGYKGKISAGCAFISFIVHGITVFLHDLADSGYIVIRYVGSCLDHNERIVGDTCQTDKCLV